MGFINPEELAPDVDMILNFIQQANSHQSRKLVHFSVDTNIDTVQIIVKTEITQSAKSLIQC